MGAADGQTRSDHVWTRRLRLLLEKTQLTNLTDALRAMSSAISIDIELLLEVVEEQRKEWIREKKMQKLGLPDSYIEFALAIYVYTLEDPKVYGPVNWAMFDPSRRVKGAAADKDISDELAACAQYIRMLDEALCRLPVRFHVRGRVKRGIKWVYPYVGPRRYLKSVYSAQRTRSHSVSRASSEKKK